MLLCCIYIPAGRFAEYNLIEFIVVNSALCLDHVMKWNFLTICARQCLFMSIYSSHHIPDCLGVMIAWLWSCAAVFSTLTSKQGGHALSPSGRVSFKIWNALFICLCVCFCDVVDIFLVYTLN